MTGQEAYNKWIMAKDVDEFRRVELAEMLDCLVKYVDELKAAQQARALDLPYFCGEEYTYGEFCKNCTDGAAVEAPAGHWLDISTDTHKRLSALKNGVYCRLCQDTITYPEMKPFRKDDDTVEMLCPGCDSVLVEGE